MSPIDSQAHPPALQHGDGAEGDGSEAAKVVALPGRVLSFQTGQAKDTANMLEVLESLKREVMAGKVIAFACAGVRPDDTAAAWAGSEGCVSRLRMQGAIAQLLHNYLSGEVA